MEKLTLYFCPLTCARVTMVALEQAQADYDVRMLNLMTGDHKKPDYLSLNPMGRVPALQVGDRLIAENAAILIYLDERFPEAGLLPATADPVARAMARADVIWCATTLHPLVRQIRAPFHYTGGDTAGIQAKGVAGATAMLEILEGRLLNLPWWFGSDWSIVDAYLGWVVAGWCSAIDLAPYRAVEAHFERVTTHPVFRTMYDRESALLAETGMQLPPGMTR